LFILFYSLFLLLTGVCYLSVLVPPNVWWPAGFLSYSIPVWMAVHLTFLVIFIIKPNKKIILPLIGLLAGVPFFDNTFAWNQQSKGSFSVLTYNVKSFNSNIGNLDSMLEWIASDSSDVKCIQEFYITTQDEYQHIMDILLTEGYDYFLTIPPDEKKQNIGGLMIISKFPIIDKGIVEFGVGYHKAGFVELKVEEDTIRVYNTHLHSMAIQEEMLGQLENTYDDLLSRLKTGYITRARQVNILTEHLEKIEKPFVVCGDINEIPYSYTYYKLNKSLLNAFETAGRGFGFTFNGLLFFLRIDNQFYNQQLEAKSLDVRREVEFSDHFPVVGTYVIK